MIGVLGVMQEASRVLKIGFRASGDVILLQYTPCQIASNFLVNMFGFKVVVHRGFFTKGNSAARNFSIPR